MIGFLSREKDFTKKVKKDEIYFLSVPNGMKKADIKLNFSKLALEFARKFNIEKVYLHTGKDLIYYDFKV